MKNTQRATLFIIILLVLITSISIFFKNYKYLPKSNISLVGISGEKNNSLDYIVLGDSETYTSIIPLEIWHNYGYTGYVLGTPAQRLRQTKEILKESLKNQKPKLLILETNAIFRKPRIKDIKTTIVENYLPLINYHDNWKYVLYSDYKKYNLDEKGYVYSTKIQKPTNTNYKVSTTKKRKIQEENMQYLEDIFQICKDNDIKVLLISVPTTQNWTYKKHNSIEELKEQHDIDFIDLNLIDELGIDWETDSQDKGDHLNYNGALKVTNFLGDYLDSMNTFEDHRGDEYYKDWDENYKKYLLKFE